jgi:hypothetical protein
MTIGSDKQTSFVEQVLPACRRQPQNILQLMVAEAATRISKTQNTQVRSYVDRVGRTHKHCNMGQNGYGEHQ